MHEAELLAAIRANPDDDAPRMLYADALLDRGDERGQYIQLALKGVYHEWLHANSTRIEHAWQAELGCTSSNPFLTFKRGFPVLIGGSLENIANARDAIAIYPITTLSVYGMTSFAPLAALPELQFIRHLELSQREPVAASVIAQIVGAPYLAPKKLELGRTLTDEAARVWATAPWLAALESFQTWKSPVTGAGIAALAMPALRGLRISEVALGDVGAEAVARFGEVETMHLASCVIGAAGARALFGSRSMERVTMFNASHNPLSAGVRSLVSAPQLRVLELANCGLESHAAQLARAELPSLVSLDVSGNGVTVEVTTAFACANLPALELLDLRMNRLDFAGVAPFEAITGLPALRNLGLCKNQLSSGKTETVEGGDEWNPWITTVDIELTPIEVSKRLNLRTGISVF